MPLNFSGAYLVGYNQTNNFFGDNLYRRASTISMTISSIIDVRNGAVNKYPSSPTVNQDNLGVQEVYDFLDSQTQSISDWQEINIDYGNGETLVATGRINSLDSIRPNPVRVGEFSVDIEIPTSGDQDAWNMSQTLEFPQTKVQSLFQESGAAFQDFSEQFDFTIGDDGSYQYDHTLNVQMFSGEHLCKDPIATAKDVAKLVFFGAANDTPSFGFVDSEFSGFYKETTEANLTDVTKSGVKYFSESYDLQNLNCTFSKRTKLDKSLKDEFSVELSHSLTMGTDGYVNVTEEGKVKSTLNKSIDDRYNIVTTAMENQIGSAKTRCDSFFDNYRLSGVVNPNYRWTEVSSTDYDSDTLFDKAISVGRALQPSIAEASYTVSFTNNKHTYETNGLHQYTQSVSEGSDGIVNVSLNGSFTKYYPNKPPTTIASDYNWITNIYDSIKGDFLTKAQATYAYYKSKQNRSYTERNKTSLPVTAYTQTKSEPTIALVSSSVTLPKFGSSVEYQNRYTDDPSILKDNSPLYTDHNFRKFSVSTNDTMMKPINSTYVIAGKRHEIVHDSGQTAMGNRSFNIQAFIKRPTQNTLENISVWNMAPKLEAIKKEISQIMANIVADAKLKTSGSNLVGDTFVQNVSFSLDSKGNFSASGNIPFISLKGEKFDTLGRIL